MTLGATSGASVARRSPWPGRSPTTRASTVCRSWWPAAAWCCRRPPARSTCVSRSGRCASPARRRSSAGWKSGPVEVVNLMGDRSRVGIDLAVLEAGQTRDLGPAIAHRLLPRRPGAAADRRRNVRLGGRWRPQDRKEQGGVGGLPDGTDRAGKRDERRAQSHLTSSLYSPFCFHSRLTSQPLRLNSSLPSPAGQAGVRRGQACIRPWIRTCRYRRTCARPRSRRCDISACGHRRWPMPSLPGMRPPARSTRRWSSVAAVFIAASATATVADTLSNVVSAWPVGRRSRSDHRLPSGARSVR